MKNEDKPGDYGDRGPSGSYGTEDDTAALEAALERCEEDRKRVLARYRSLLDLSRDGIAAVTGDGKIVEANGAFAEIFGVRADQIVEMNLGAFCANSIDWSAIGKRMETERIVRNLEWRAVTGDGTEKECLLTFALLSEPDNTESLFLVIVTDETDRRKSMQIMLQTDRMKAMAAMAGSVAHSIRNLLQLTVSGTRLALANLDSGRLTEVRTHLEQVVGSLRSAGETARLLNHFASVRGEKPMRRGRIFDLTEVVGKAVEIRQAWLDANPGRTNDKIAVTTSLEPGCAIRGVENDLLEVVVNLLWNAVDAMPGGGEIRLKTWVEPGHVYLEVSDTGVGIRKEDLSKVFQPFWTTKGLLGTGLGLAGSYGIVTHHGGEIAVESVEGRGTTFRVNLPLAERMVHRVQSPKPPHPADSTCNILVIDDLEPLLRMLKSELIKRGHKVFAASSGKEALEIFRNTEIDIVLCDLAMPEMNGWEVGKAVKRISEEQGRVKTPFVMVTGWGGSIDKQEAIEAAGVDSVLEKPVDIGKLSEVIKELVGDRSSA